MKGNSDIYYKCCMAGAKRNSNLLFRRGPDLSIYHFPSALLRPCQSTSFGVSVTLHLFRGSRLRFEVLDFGDPENLSYFESRLSAVL